MTKFTLATSGWRRWSDEEDAHLEQMWRNGMLDDEISAEIGRTEQAIRLRRERFGLMSDAEPAATVELYATVQFPQFEDITKAEAREILRTAPPSARFTVVTAYSLTGNSSEMCAAIETWKRNPKRS